MNGPVPVKAVLAPHLHLNKLRDLKAAAQLLDRDEFHLPGLRVAAGAGKEDAEHRSSAAG